MSNFYEPQIGDELSNAEKEVLRLLGLGLSNKQIASLLDNSVRTIETHRAKIAKKTGYSGSRLIIHAYQTLVGERKQTYATV